MYPTLESTSLSHVIVSVVLRAIAAVRNRIRERDRQGQGVEMHIAGELLYRHDSRRLREILERNARLQLERDHPQFDSSDDDNLSPFVKEEKEAKFKPRFKRRHLNKRFV